MIGLSVIIVNYNVRQFVLQTLHSIYQSQLDGLSIEVVVVDNNSSDGSVEAIRDHFPQTTIIANKNNPGFSKANNQGIGISKGEFVLLLNPDTVLEEYTLAMSVARMKAESDIGALGVKMIDGTGTFLPESKRSFPTPWNSLMKLLGLSSMFPSSKILGGYNLTYLNENKTHDIDVLCGAFMLMRRSALDNSGLLDEEFFMYGEDIDLSYRIKQSGYRILYYPETQIIHYKGESTKKSSVNYVKVFYNAMIIYVKKHYNGRTASFFVLMLSMAIYFIAGISLVRRLWDRLKYPIVDAGLILANLHGAKWLWGRYYYNDVEYYAGTPMYANLVVYTLIWVLCLAIYGHYSKVSNAKSLLRGVSIGTILILVIYALLPLAYRSSRAVLLMGAAATLIICWITTLLWNRSIRRKWTLSRNPKLNVLIAASELSTAYIKEMILKSSGNLQLIGNVSIDEKLQSEKTVGSIDNLVQIAQEYEVDEIVFSSKDMNYHDIMSFMNALGDRYQYKIGGDQYIGVIGSNSKNHSGEYYSADLQYRLDQPYSKRQKRVFDIWSSLLILLLSPLILILNRFRWKSISHTWQVLIGKMTWVSYIPCKGTYENMPEITPAVISLDSNIKLPLTNEQQRNTNQDYARYYEVWDDQVLLLRNLNRLHIRY
ncbi:MAG: glycosyltransferase family 2 protein [Saprospiraceae bacterium]